VVVTCAILIRVAVTVNELMQTRKNHKRVSHNFYTLEMLSKTITSWSTETTEDAETYGRKTAL